jgi:DNA replication protein DnaC
MDRIATAESSMKTGAMVALVGKRGSGKTQLALWLANRFAKPHIYMRVDNLCNCLKSWLSLDHEAKTNNARMLRTVPLLIIDEFQERQRTEYEDLNITSILDKRYGEALPTIIIANLKPEEFARDAGSSISSRLTEGGTMVVCDWASFRGATA